MSDETPEEEGRGRGQPTKYRPEFVAQAEKLCALGATDPEIADFFGVATRTVERWKVEHEDFCRAIKDAKAIADARVERSLYQRALGYEQDEVKIFMPADADEPVYAPYRAKIAGDVTAMIFWLKNRKSAEWKDRKDVATDNRHHHTADPVSPFAEFLAASVAARAKDASEEPVPN